MNETIQEHYVGPVV